MITDAVQSMSKITDPEELVSFMEETASAYRTATKPKTRLGYAVLVLLWALIVAISGIGANYWLGVLLELGWVIL